MQGIHPSLSKSYPERDNRQKIGIHDTYPWASYILSTPGVNVKAGTNIPTRLSGSASDPIVRD